jgi:hypothetical protein
MTTYLRNRNIQHFLQAKNTPYTIGELGKVLEENIISTTLNHVLKVKVPETLEKQTKDMLTGLKQVSKQLLEHIPLKPWSSASLNGKKRQQHHPVVKTLVYIRRSPKCAKEITNIRQNKRQVRKPSMQKTT